MESIYESSGEQQLGSNNLPSLVTSSIIQRQTILGSPETHSPSLRSSSTIPTTSSSPALLHVNTFSLLANEGLLKETQHIEIGVDERNDGQEMTDMKIQVKPHKYSMVSIIISYIILTSRVFQRVKRSSPGLEQPFSGSNNLNIPQSESSNIICLSDSNDESNNECDLDNMDDEEFLTYDIKCRGPVGQADLGLVYGQNKVNGNLLNAYPGSLTCPQHVVVLSSWYLPYVYNTSASKRSTSPNISKRRTPRLPIPPQGDYVVIPAFNPDAEHWSVIIGCWSRATILSLDSLPTPAGKSFFTKSANLLSTKWNTEMARCIDEANPTELETVLDRNIKWTNITVRSSYQQSNSTDCGFYVMGHIETFLRDPPGFFARAAAHKDLSGSDGGSGRFDVDALRRRVLRALSTECLPQPYADARAWLYRAQRWENDTHKQLFVTARDSEWAIKRRHAAVQAQKEAHESAMGAMLQNKPSSSSSRALRKRKLDRMSTNLPYSNLSNMIADWPRLNEEADKATEEVSRLAAKRRFLHQR
ncbi:hypothetical protein BX600DRAFT_523104 [Xylariales sp. PMI_506]|nr:hypothetical protein BX600DRAFT_523104 [Xylariales sp. PMI_506]